MSVKRVLIICTITLLVTIILEIALVHHHIEYWWHGFIGFDIIFGFAGCVAIIIVSKLILKPLVQRKEDYYDGGGDEHD